MCGIVGLFLKDKSLEPQLGAMLSEMLISLSDRGPDSAGIAIYGAPSRQPGQDHHPVGRARARFPRARRPNSAKAIGAPVSVAVKSTHAVVDDPTDKARRGPRGHRRRCARRSASWAPARSSRSTRRSACPTHVVDRFDVRSMAGTHGIGHTRMATESAVTTLGAHPFSTGADQCLVHNGSLSNHNNVRRELIRDGMTFETENDTEVAAAYLSSRMAHGMNLGEALEGTLERSRRLLHLRRRHQERLRRGARSDRLQAGRDGRDRPVRRLRLGIPRAGQPARHRRREGLGAGARDRLFLGALSSCRQPTPPRRHT